MATYVLATWLAFVVIFSDYATVRLYGRSINMALLPMEYGGSNIQTQSINTTTLTLGTINLGQIGNKIPLFIKFSSGSYRRHTFFESSGLLFAQLYDLAGDSQRTVTYAPANETVTGTLYYIENI